MNEYKFVTEKYEVAGEGSFTKKNGYSNTGITHVYLINIYIRRLLDQGVEKYGKNDRNLFVDLMLSLLSDEEFKKKVFAYDNGIAKSTLKNREKMLELLK